MMIGLLYVGVLAVQVAMPDGHPLRETTGGSAGEWLLLGGLGALVWVYAKGLTNLKKRVRPENLPEQKKRDSSVELERNARHIVLREIGGPGQKRLKDARVLVIGAGGLGAPALQYLAAAGVGTIGVIDDDIVENSNLQRQVIHTDDRIGMPKVFSAEAAMTAQNPFVTVPPLSPPPVDRHRGSAFRRLRPDPRWHRRSGDPLSGQRNRGEGEAPPRFRRDQPLGGQISVFDPSRGAPCYACVFPDPPAPGLAPSCAEGGVLGPLPGVLGAMMAVEAVKLISGAGEPLLGRMLIYDALYAETRTITVKPRPDCVICRGGAL